jgi:hypothetical protein
MPFDGTKLDEATRVLIEARQILIEKGWITCVCEDDEGRHCAMGAINAVFDHHSRGTGGPAYQDRGKPMVDRLYDAIPKEKRALYSDDRLSAVPCFNNDQKDVSVVLDWFNRAISSY